MVTIDLWQLWQDLKSNTNTKQGGQLRPRDFNNWVNIISIELFNEKFAAWEKNQSIVDELSRPFLESKSFATKKTAKNYCLLEYPQDYAYFSSARIFKTPDGIVKSVDECPQEGSKSVLADLCEVGATKVDNARWGSVCSNKIIPPTMDRVFITQYEGGFKIAPKDIGYVTLDYLRYPKRAYLAFLPGRNQEYDKANTIPLEWGNIVSGEFLTRLIMAYGNFIKEPFLVSVANNKKETTV